MNFTQILNQMTQSAGIFAQSASSLLSSVASITLPIPDVAMVFAFALLAGAIKLSSRGEIERVRADVTEQFQSELLSTNRRAQQVRGELRKAQLETERERQRRRNERLRGDDRGSSQKAASLKAV